MHCVRACEKLVPVAHDSVERAVASKGLSRLVRLIAERRAGFSVPMFPLHKVSNVTHILWMLLESCKLCSGCKWQQHVHCTWRTGMH